MWVLFSCLRKNKIQNKRSNNNNKLKGKVNQLHTGQKGFEGSQLQKSSTVAVTRTAATTAAVTTTR